MSADTARPDHKQDLVLLGQAIRQVREQHGVSLSELAAAGFERQQISALEAGKLDPTYELLIALAGGLGVGLSALVLRAQER